ncbi:MAG TPA: hypothetical protein VKY89_15975 [Thermoanaerobaculia bacterium]|jgi:hypothetical protein|nr:hypothetical protein [Thermoanaerobaculia bacterium]
MGRSLVSATILAAILSTSAALATTCNLDWRNTGTQTADDLALVLPGLNTITQWYDGTPGCDDVFGAASATQAGGNTTLHWTNPATSIPPDPHGTSPQVHVGWTTSDNTCPQQVTGYWTDKNGNAIPGSFVAVVVDHVTPTEIAITNTLSSPITIANVRFAQVSSPVALPALNRCNQALVGQLQTLSDGGVLNAGQTLHVPIPNPPCYECNVVVNYDVSGAALDAVAGVWAADVTPGQP